jgi:hypothetical protein
MRQPEIEVDDFSFRFSLLDGAGIDMVERNAGQ